MDNRFRKINRLLSEYSLGNFDKKLGLSSHRDEIDAFISGVNMLGEELKEKTISRNYFNNIFNSVSDMVFVLHKQGRIENINQSVTNHLQYDLDFLAGRSMNYLLPKLQPGWFNSVINELQASRTVSQETVFKSRNSTQIPALISAILLIGEKKGKEKIIITAKDISEQKKTQNILLKAIIETEENERIRFAKDIHDSIGQQLSAIKFYIGTSAEGVQDVHQKSILIKANAALLDVHAEMRNICFNIMPKSLEIFGLVKVVEELCAKYQLLDKMKIIIREFRGFPRLPVQQEFAIFRIIQEFINNTLKHSIADTIQIEFRRLKKTALIELFDNGIGFDLNKLPGRGMGLNNVRSRIRPYNGEVEIISLPGKGTKYEITIPLENK